ncbi:hypothetical protein OROMI_022021 [Orobanche minor]
MSASSVVNSGSRSPTRVLMLSGYLPNVTTGSIALNMHIHDPFDCMRKELIMGHIIWFDARIGNHSRSHPSILPEQKHPSRITKITEPPRLIYCNPLPHPVTNLPEQDFGKILKIGPINDMEA